MIMFVPKFRYLHKRAHLYTYGQNHGNKIESNAAIRIGRRISQRFIARFPYTMQDGAIEVTGPEFSPNRRASGNAPGYGQQLGETLRGGGHQGPAHPSRSRTQAYYRHTGRGNHPASHRKRPLKCFGGQGAMGVRDREDGLRGDAKTFFKRVGARFGRIRKRPKGKPSPRLYQHKLWELQELERLWHNGSIDLYYGDESHICEEAYVPYGWKFSKEDVYIPSQRGARLNCFAMIDRRCHTYWFTTGKSIDADTMIGFLDNFSMNVRRKTVIVLDNAPIHRAKKLLALRDIWEKRGLHLFFLPPYSPQLNIAEILWRMLKGKWLQPKDYLTADTLFYAANRALAAMGNGLMINFKYHAA